MLSLFKKKTKKVVTRTTLDFSFDIFEKEIEYQIKGWLGLKEGYLEVFAQILFSLGVPVKQVKFLKYNKSENCFTILAHDAWIIHLRYGNWDFLDEIWIQKDSITKKYDFIFRKDEFQVIYRGQTEECCGFTANSCFMSHYSAFSNINSKDALSITINLDFNFASPITNKQAQLECYTKSIPATLSTKEILKDILNILNISVDEIERIDKIEIKRYLIDPKKKHDDFTTHSLFYTKGIVTSIVDTDNIATTSFSVDDHWTYTENDFTISYSNQVYNFNGTVSKETNINLLMVKAESAAMHLQDSLMTIQSFITQK